MISQQKTHANMLSCFPPTRYQGSKLKLLSWLKTKLQSLPLPYQTVLDAFGGTGAVSYLFKTLGKAVHTNDLLQCNQYTAKALIENQDTQLDQDTLEALLQPRADTVYDDLIARTFEDIYFTHAENQWLDMMAHHIHAMPQPYPQAMAWWALFQAALSKRPYNLFHRKNLYVRTAKVSRSFGNKATWDRPFPEHFRNFAKQANAAIFDNHQPHSTSCGDVLALSPGFDLVYLDPPYIPAKGSLTRYADFYHFLEGLLDYHQWEQRIDYDSKHRKLRSEPSVWEQRNQIEGAFQAVFQHFRDSILVLSYREDGTPGIPTLLRLMQQVKSQVSCHTIDYQYALSKQRSQEVLLIGI